MDVLQTSQQLQALRETYQQLVQTHGENHVSTQAILKEITALNTKTGDVAVSYTHLRAHETLSDL
eukprot:12350394-Karenia_brevis.AAC.1